MNEEPLLPRVALEAWTVPEMPNGMKERVMSELDEQWSLMAPAAAPQPASSGVSIAAIATAGVALALSAAAVAIVTLWPAEPPPQPTPAAPAPTVLAVPPTEAPAVDSPASQVPPPIAPEVTSPPPAGVKPGAHEHPPLHKRVPRVRQGAALIKGEMDKDTTRRIVRVHINEVRQCYNQGLILDPGLKGRIAVKFTISPAGKVPVAVVSRNALADRSVGTCVAKAIKRWRFPKPNGNVVVMLPFVFDPG